LAYGGAGGSGIIVLRYPDIFVPAANITGGVYTTYTGYRLYTFTGTGTITFYN
jgi:hypothetical protein